MNRFVPVNRNIACALTVSLLVAALASVAQAQPVAAAPDAPLQASAAPERPAEWATPIDPSRNLYRITPQLYRSAQPEQRDVPRLQALGIRTIINFRARHRDEDAFTMPGVKLVWIPMNTWWIGDEQIVRAILAVESALKDGPVLIHCQHGADRTGVVSAMYRILNQGWTPEQASHELKRGNFGFHGIWVNIPLYLKHLDIERVRRQMAAARQRADAGPARPAGDAD